MSDDLTGLGPRGFERMCRALAAYVLGPGIEAFGAGPDGGREATFCGLQQYPSASEPWNGYGVLQAKYKERLLGTGADAAWLRRQIKAELDAWASPGKRRVWEGRRPEYLIFATNVPLSGVPGSGGKDRIGTLIAGYAKTLGLEGWRVWDAAQISTFLDAYPQVRRAFAALITPSEVLADMRDRLGTPPEVSVVLSMPATVIKPGQPGNEAAFQPAYAAAGGAARLGEALGEVQEEGPGWVQCFSGGPGAEPAVICAGYGQPAVAVAGRLWQALLAVGGGRPGGGTVGAGFPDTARLSGPFVGSDSQDLQLTGGEWGPGRLIQQGSGHWAWQPNVAFDSEACRDKDTWTGRGGDMDLRLRVATRIPVTDGELRIGAAGRARLVAALRKAGLNKLLEALAARYGLKAGMPEWEETPEPNGHNNSRFAAYQVPVAAADGRPALLGSVWFSLPGATSNSLSGLADLRISFDAIRSAPGPAAVGPARVPVDLQVRLDDLTGFFAQAWQTTTMILPLAITTSPPDIPLAGPPRLELYITNERPEMGGADLPLQTLDMVDLSSFGQPRRSQLGDLSVGVTTPLGLREAEITSLVGDAMVRMTEDFGFTSPALRGP